MVGEVSQDTVLTLFPLIYVWPLGMAQQDYHSHNKTHIVRLSIWIWYFYLLWPNQAEFNSRAASDIKVFSTVQGTVGLSMPNVRETERDKCPQQ